ncbi:flagellar hook-basal body complex protein FliE [Treponema socranskii]|uniref:flagellar hook-basal body complex protein FliE n=1 Tax=Treponema socranskii TaxID=53419 RepID=UPI0020A44B5A|nr:flagellar hook-basal body complex protein FliE [Treponema socranskii]UTD02899.1 flagellar hook-basal body complex protein FliE [Treponema socranskii subsp. buccale]
MKIPEFGILQMNRTLSAHTGRAKLSDIAGAPLNGIPSAAKNALEKKRIDFESYLIDAVKSMNADQLDVNALEQKILTEPESVDPQDVTIAMAKARMSLSLAQNVIDRIVSGWNEITTTR